MPLFSEERRLGELERPLLVQLNWGKDDREGRFLLRNEDYNKNIPVSALKFYKLEYVIKFQHTIIVYHFIVMSPLYV